MKIEKSEPWRKAVTLLRRFAPGAVDFVPDHVADAIRSEGRGLSWEPLASFGGDDDDVWHELFDRVPTLREGGGAVLVCDASYSDERGPISLTWGEMRGPVPDMVGELDDEVFGGDAVILTPAILVLVHHEGISTAVDLESQG